MVDNPSAEWAEEVRNADAVVNLSGFPIASYWTAKNRALLTTSRLDTTHALVRAIAAAPKNARPKVLVSASAVGIYGDACDRLLDEDSPLGCDFLASLAIGLAAGATCYFAVTRLKARFAYDDSLDVFGVHGVGGLVGALLTGLLADEAVSGAKGHLLTQAIGVGAVLLYSAIATLGVLWFTHLMVGLRVDEAAEQTGLDIAEHREHIPG